MRFRQNSTLDRRPRIALRLVASNDNASDEERAPHDVVAEGVVVGENSPSANLADEAENVGGHVDVQPGLRADGEHDVR